MSSAIVRRNSSKQGLQNLLRVTAQRSIEDAEEIERERRRRAREAFRKEESLSGSTGSPQDSMLPPEAGPYESDFKPSAPAALEEDEGFSDWTQKLERGKRLKMEENGRKEGSSEVDMNRNARPRQTEKTNFTTLIQHHQTSDKEQEGEEKRPIRRSSEKRIEIIQMVSSQKPEEWLENIRDIKEKQDEPKTSVEDKVKDERREVKVSYTSKVFIQQDNMPNGSGEAAVGEGTSQLLKTKRSPRSIGVHNVPEMKKEIDTGLETEMKLEKIRRSHQEKESQEMEQLRQRQVEAEQELEDLKKKREERRRFREEEEQRKEEEEQDKLTRREVGEMKEEKKQMKEEIERRRLEAAEKRMKNLNISATDGDDPFNPMNPKSPTAKITERTESLNRSLKKSNSFKKIQRPVLLPKIDDKLEQYTQAIEISSKDIKNNKVATLDMPCILAPVASKKNMFEVGDAWNQSTLKGTPTKETDCVKVGVATLINHWVKGSPEGGNKNSPSTPSDVKPGDVLQKKNMWEIIGEAEKSGLGGKGTSLGKRYKFVVTGHGKYEKIPTDGDHYSDYPNGKTSESSTEDL